MGQPNIDPRGLELFQKYGELSEDEKLNSPEAAALMVEMMQYLPQEVQEQMHNMAVEMGLMPEKPSGYLEDGTPVFNVEQIAENLGMNVKEAIAHTERMNQVTAGKYAIDPSKVHRVQ